MLFGYYTQQGFRGYVHGVWILFATEEEYYEYMSE